MDVQLAVEPGAEDVFAEIAGFERLGDRFLRVLRAFLVGVAQKEVADRRLQGVGRDDHPFDQLMRVRHQQLAVLVGAGLHLVAVADQVLLAGLVDREERPFQAGDEAGAATPAQPRTLDQLDQVFRAHLQRLAQALVAAGLLVFLEQDRLARTTVLEQHLRVVAHAPTSARMSARMVSTCSGVSGP